MRSWLLFGHLVGVVLVVGASLAQGLAGNVMRNATTVAELRTLQRVLAPSGPLGGIGMVLLLATGLTMAARDWSFTDGWISTSMVLLALAIVAGLLVSPRSRRLREALAAAAPTGVAPAEVTDAARDRVVHVTQRVLVVVQFEIVALMALKPSGGGILASLLAASVVAGAISLPLLTSRPGRPTRPRPATR